jgi:hypothetical protein
MGAYALGFTLSPASQAFLNGAYAPGFTLSPASQALLIWGLPPSFTLSPASQAEGRNSIDSRQRLHNITIDAHRRQRYAARH